MSSSLYEYRMGANVCFVSLWHNCLSSVSASVRRLLQSAFELEGIRIVSSVLCHVVHINHSEAFFSVLKGFAARSLCYELLLDVKTYQLIVEALKDSGERLWFMVKVFSDSHRVFSIFFPLGRFLVRYLLFFSYIRIEHL